MRADCPCLDPRDPGYVPGTRQHPAGAECGHFRELPDHLHAELVPRGRKTKQPSALSPEGT